MLSGLVTGALVLLGIGVAVRYRRPIMDWLEESLSPSATALVQRRIQPYLLEAGSLSTTIPYGERATRTEPDGKKVELLIFPGVARYRKELRPDGTEVWTHDDW